MIPGVYLAKRKNGVLYYRSSITYKNKHISLGSFETETAANHAYNDAHSLLGCTLGLTDSFHDMALPFEKIVVLINFRDNNVYIRNPIYLQKRYFEYYLTKTIIYKFDIDDLFYYSEHKISIRKGHLFVADYGMQVNLASRYGIRNHAVQNRDYKFINGDPFDYRYENIEIINRYNGVMRVSKNNHILYKSYIHIKGNCIIGYYETETEAAIAYNKAVDFLSHTSYSKDYTQNYIDNIAPSMYADIYTLIHLPSKLLLLEKSDYRH